MIFISSPSVFALALLFAGAFANPIHFPSELQSRQQSLYDCLSAHDVPTDLISSANWTSLVTPYNLALPYTPTAITLPTTPQQVSDSVTCASQASVKVQAKSGGHSYGSFSSGGKNGSLVVDLQEFNSISVDNATGIATVGGGVRLGNLALGIYSQDNRALPHGTCPGVGIGGHFTHGGFGFDSRLWGLALDTIVALDVVLANGSYVHCTETDYPEIYFALRGAADSFGIVTTFYLQTLPAPETVVVFSASIPAALSSATVAANAFQSLQTFATSSSYMSRNITFGITTGASAFSVNGWYFGDEQFFANTMFPAMLADLPAPASTNVTSQGWIAALTIEAGTDPLTQPLSGYAEHDTFYAKSVVTKNEEPLTQEALESYFAYELANGASAPPWFSIVNLYGGLDSQINTRLPGSSAYSDRDALWVFQNYASAAESESGTFIDGLTNALTSAQPTGNFSAYLNYLDPSLTPDQAADLYYGADLYRKLVAIKEVVDPTAVFWNPQSIGNANLSAI